MEHASLRWTRTQHNHLGQKKNKKQRGFENDWIGPWSAARSQLTIPRRRHRRGVAATLYEPPTHKLPPTLLMSAITPCRHARPPYRSAPAQEHAPRTKGLIQTAVGIPSGLPEECVGKITDTCKGKVSGKHNTPPPPRALTEFDC